MAPFVRYLFLALVILIAVRFVAGRRSPRIEINVRESSSGILVSLIAFWICVTSECSELLRTQLRQDVTY